MSAIWKRLEEKEEGFTLIELLVVVIIIGILAAIAIPVFLNQRERAWQAELTSSVRNAALDIEAEATAAGGEYPDATDGQATIDAFLVDSLGHASATDPVEVEYSVNGGQTAFTLCGEHVRLTGGEVQGYDSSAGGVLDFNAACTTP